AEPEEQGEDLELGPSVAPTEHRAHDPAHEDRLADRVDRLQRGSGNPSKGRTQSRPGGDDAVAW
ncbi:MAG: hypothetical protein KBG77_09405, partial [Dermatophilaceae bacterium]|nr:hypothetical protein [Dermatophilaceae bacterium]